MLSKSQLELEIADSANHASSSESDVQNSQLHQSVTGIAKPHISMSYKTPIIKQSVSSWITGANNHMINTLSLLLNPSIQTHSSAKLSDGSFIQLLTWKLSISLTH